MIWPRESSGTMIAFTRFDSAATCSSGNPSVPWFRPVTWYRYPSKKFAIGGTSPLLSSYGRYSDGGQVGFVRLTTGRTPGSGISIRSRMCPTISSKAMMTGGRYFSERLNARTVSVDPEFAVHDVALAGAGRNAGRRAAAHDVDDHARDLGQHREPHVLLLEREAGAGSGREGLRSREGSADHRGHRGDLVLHLQERPADLRETPRHELGHLGRRGDRVAAEEGAPRVEGAFRARLVTLEQLDLAHRISPLSGSYGTLFLFHEDGEIRAPQLARHADRALVDVDHLHLEHLHPEHLRGAKLHADLASLAEARDDADLHLRILGRLDLLRSLLLRHRSLFLPLFDFQPETPGESVPHVGGCLGHGDPRSPERLDLLRRRPLAAGDDGAGVAHPLPLGGGLPRHEPHHRLGHLRFHVGGRLFLRRAADLADHDDRLGLRIGLERGKDVDELFPLFLSLTNT